MEHVGFSCVRSFQCHVVVDAKGDVFIGLHVVVDLLDDVVASGAKSHQILAVFACAYKRAYGRKLGCDLVLCHRIYGTAALPVCKLTKLKAKCLGALARVNVEVFAFGLQSTAGKIAKLHCFLLLAYFFAFCQNGIVMP